jgi:hypothetical protein
LDEKYQTTTWIFKNLSKNTITTIWMKFSQMLTKHTNYLRNQRTYKKVLNNNKMERFLTPKEERGKKKGERTNHKKNLDQISNNRTLFFTYILCLFSTQ